MTATFALHTIGCRLNQYELEAVGAKLESLGFQQVPFGSVVDFTIINTCTVTARADRDGRNAVRRARRISPTGKIVVTGCYAHAQPAELHALGEVDLLVDNLDKERLAERLVSAFGFAPPAAIDFEYLGSPGFAVERFARHTRAMVKIQDGCQEACSYCIIPRARGVERSRPPQAIYDEVSALEANGYKEVVLTGVHVGKYRHQDLRLHDLLGALLVQSGVPQFRLTSMEPREFRSALVDLLVAKERCCPHLHIPIQSGQDDILRAMRRSYDTAFIRTLFARLTTARPDLAIGTDVITGFPGESDSQFTETVEFVESLPVAYLHVFSYSDRPGTKAQAMVDKVSPEIIKARTKQLRLVSKSLRQRFVARFVGRTVPVLIERRRDRDTGLLVGMSDNYMRVMTDGPDQWMNEIVPLRIVRCEDEIALGEVA